MFVTKFALPAFAVLGLAAAQSSSCAAATVTHTINSQADATALASSCSTIGGSVAIASSVAGAIALDGIEQIEGDLTCNGAVNMTSLGGSTLNSIGGDFILTSLTIMSTLSFPSLTSVKSLQWQTLNALQELTFTQGLTKANAVTISDTQLNDLNGISLMTVGTLDINNNLYLKEINIALTNVTSLLNIDSNGPGLAVTFADMQFAYNMTLRNLTSITIPALTSVNSTLGFYGDLMTDITAPNLTSVGGDLAVIANPNLLNVSMPLLTTVGGGFTFANNTALDKVNGLPSLKSTGAINFTGNFSEADLPSLTDCKGSFNMQSSGDIDCSPFQADKSSSVIKGSYTCVSQSKNVQSSGTGTGSSSGASSTSTKNAAPMAMMSDEMPFLMGAFAVIGGLFGLL